VHYFWWIPTVILYYFVYYWLTKLNNAHSNLSWHTSKYFWWMFLYGALCPMWLIVCRVSKNLVFDGMLYDAIMVIVYPLSMYILGAGAKFSLINWIGAGIVTVGLILMQVKL